MIDNNLVYPVPSAGLPVVWYDIDSSHNFVDDHGNLHVIDLSGSGNDDLIVKDGFFLRQEPSSCLN